ncbi:MAG: Stk1 family PASTA domain-containing Ser/Thr kinase [Lachnospiraceae bacterium]
MVSIGMILANRYEVIDKIGTGGMSDVYKALDHTLNRNVAIKVLKQEFSENANFVSKFRVEAQAAAGLLHSNIVNVYDVGQEKGIHYIIMELVEGITLKQYILKKARITYKEAVSIAIQVAMGIEAAHNHHMIHRDIKPQNIMVSMDGKVKVTDFGIAKAVSSETITSNVMGSVHYTSPEQTRGGYSDEKSDIYSLGITLFEMLTGRVPFQGDTTVAVAIKHIQEPMPSPRDYIPEIPVSVEKIVLKCCAKSIDRRYQSMSELMGDLKKALMNPEEDFVQMNDTYAGDETRVIPSSQWTNEDHRELDEDDQQTYFEEDEAFEEVVRIKPISKEKLVTIIMLAVGFLIICIAAMLIIKNIDTLTGSLFGMNETVVEENDGEEISMISVAGLTEDAALLKLTALGLVVEKTYISSETIAANVVISADIAQGSTCKVGDSVILLISTGTESVEILDVTGMTQTEGVEMLQEQGFIVSVTESYSDVVEKGYIISQNPTGNQALSKGSAVTVRVSLGEEDTRVRIPNVIGLDLDSARSELTDAGVSVGTVEEVNSSDVGAGLVCYQSYPVGSYVDSGTQVNLKISLGAEAATYSYQTQIQAPSVTEAPDYSLGDVVALSLVTSEGKILLSTNTSTFPYSVNYSGITASKGTITITYSYEKTVELEDGETQVEKITDSFTREVNFAEE